MKTSAGTIRTMAYLMVALLVSTVLAACGGGGGSTSSTSPGLSGPVGVDISIATADVTGSAAPAVAVAEGGTVPSTDPAYLWPEQVTQIDSRIVHVYMDVVKVSLMSAGEKFENEVMEGNLQNGNSPKPSESPDKPGFVTIYPSTPAQIDLLDLRKGERLAGFFNKFAQVPAGTYNKIRVFYDNVSVETSDGSTMKFHPTAHSKFDIHFRQGHELVIPVASDTTQPDGWIMFFRVKLDVVGLKLQVIGQGKSWKGIKVILRPQIFAEFVPPIYYSVAGTADKVVKNISSTSISGSFDVLFGQGTQSSTTVHAAFDNNTRWTYSDNVLAGSDWKILDVPNQRAAAAFGNRAEVEVIGWFDDSKTLQGTDLLFTFPDVVVGTADNVWILDNTAFIVRSLTDNVTVFPKPSRDTAFYDNLATPNSWNAADQVFQYTDLDNNFQVRARGYFVGEDLWAYWISFSVPIIGP